MYSVNLAWLKILFWSIVWLSINSTKTADAWHVRGKRKAKKGKHRKRMFIELMLVTDSKIVSCY